MTASLLQRSSNKRRLLMSVVLLVAAFGCGTSPQAKSKGIAARLLPPGSERLASQIVFWGESEVFSWRFNTPELVAAWTPLRIDGKLGIRQGGLYLRSSSPDPSLVRDCAIDTTAVQAIRVEHSGLTSGAYMQLFWAAAGEPFAEERSLSVDHADPTGTLVPTYTFAVGRHREWQGEVARFRLDPTSVADRQVEVYSVSGLAYTASEEKIQSLIQRGWRVDLEGDVRNAVLTPPGHPFRREIDVPPHAGLELACGIPPGVTVPVRFAAVLERSGRADEILLETTLEPGGGPAPSSWHEHRIDLRATAGQRVTLRLEASSGASFDPYSGFPAWANPRLSVPRRGPQKPNVLLVVLDTLRADRLSCYGHSRQTTPRIDVWAQQRGVLFRNAVAQAPWTLPSHVSLFTGLDTISHGMNTGVPVAAGLHMLAERLREAGYETAAITGGGYLATGHSLMQGFDTVRYWHQPTVDPGETGNDIGAGTEEALRWLSGDPARPFFLLFHSYETHAPYRAREPYFSRFHGPEQAVPMVSTEPVPPQRDDGFRMRSRLKAPIGGGQPGYRPLDPVDLPLVNDLYDSNVAFADEHVGRILDQLAELGLDRDTVVVLTSDHGESLGERGLFGHSSLQECELMVPLIVAAPGVAVASRRIDTQVRLVDVAPTILELVGLDPDPDMDGRSLAPLLEGRTAKIPHEAWSYASSSNYGVGLRLANRVKYTFNNAPWPPLHGAEELFRIDQDPGEESNLAAADSMTASLRGRVIERVDADASGLRVRIANRERRPLHALLKGTILNPLQVKALAFPANTMRWWLQSLQLELEPGEDVTLFVDGPPYGELLVVGELDPGKQPLVKTVLDLDDLEKWQVVLDRSQWREDAEADLDRVTGIRVWIHGDGLRRGDGLDVDATTREQLRALGYAE